MCAAALLPARQQTPACSSSNNNDVGVGCSDTDAVDVVSANNITDDEGGFGFEAAADVVTTRPVQKRRPEQTRRRRAGERTNGRTDARAFRNKIRKRRRTLYTLLCSTTTIPR